MWKTIVACAAATTSVNLGALTHLHAILTLKPWLTMARARRRMNVGCAEALAPFSSAAVSTFCLERAIAKET
jgi:hypothetical protein